MFLVRLGFTQFLCAILVLVAGPALLAQSQSFEGKRVVTIHFDPAAQPLEPSELFEILPLKINQPLKMSMVRDSIDRLFVLEATAEIPSLERQRAMPFLLA